MSVQTQIDRISGNVSAALAAVAEKGVTVPDGSTSDALASLIASIEAGGGGGSLKYAMGTYIPAETVALNSLPPPSIETNTGFIPDIFLFFNASTGTYGMLAIVATFKILYGVDKSDYNCYVMCKGSSSMGEGGLKAFPPTENVAYIRSDISSSYHKITAGQEYTWIAIGGVL